MSLDRLDQIYQDVLDKKLAAYATELEAQLAKEVIPAEKILSKKPILGGLIKSNLKGLAVASLAATTMLGGLTAKVGMPAYKAAQQTHLANSKTMQNLPLLSTATFGPEAEIGLGLFNTEFILGKTAYDKLSRDSLGAFSPSKNVIYAPNSGNLSTIVHEISHGNKQNWPLTAENNVGFLGDYGKNNLDTQLRAAYKDSGYYGRLEKQIDSLVSDLEIQLKQANRTPEEISKLANLNRSQWGNYWLNNDEMTSRLVESVAAQRGVVPKISDTISDKGVLPMYPTEAETAKLLPAFNKLMHDSNVVRFSKMYPQENEKFQQSVFSLFTSNVANIVTGNKVVAPSVLPKISRPDKLLQGPTPNFITNNLSAQIYKKYSGSSVKLPVELNEELRIRAGQK